MDEVVESRIRPATEVAAEPTPSGDDDEAPFSTLPGVTATATAKAPGASPTAAKAKGKDSVEQAFDDLFNS
jgi:hypothetical protein